MRVTIVQDRGERFQPASVSSARYQIRGGHTHYDASWSKLLEQWRSRGSTRHILFRQLPRLLFNETEGNLYSFRSIITIFE